jgi:hypothetical protein
MSKSAGDVFEFNYNAVGTFGPTDTKVGTFLETETGEIEIELSHIPMSGRMILRRAPESAPRNG